jgi:hypothetical protein
MPRRLTKAVNFAFGANIGTMVSGLGNPAGVGTAIVNVPFRVTQIVVKEMFSSTIPATAVVARGSIGGDVITLTAANNIIEVGMTVTGTNVPAGTTVTNVSADTLTIDIATPAAIPSTPLTFTAAVGPARVAADGLTLVTGAQNMYMYTGQTITGAGFTTCVITALNGGLAYTLSSLQTPGPANLLSVSTTGTGSTSGNLIIFTGPGPIVNVGATVTGTGVTASTTVIGMTGPYAQVSAAQCVLSTPLTITDVGTGAALLEEVQVQSMDGLFPPQATLGILVQTSNLTQGVTYHDTYHYFDTPQWLRGQYQVQLLRADGISAPLNTFTGFVSVIMEFVGED